MNSILSITLVGLFVVFSVLGILYIVFSLFGITLSSEKRRNLTEAPVNAVIKEKGTKGQNTGVDESEITAAIGATLYEMIGSKSFRIKKISPVTGKKSGWKTRIPQVYWKPRRNKVC